MKLTSPQFAAALDATSEDIEKASNYFERHCYDDDEWALGSSEWRLELAYTKLLALCEILELPMLRSQIAETLIKAQGDLSEQDSDPEGNPHMKWAGPARRYHQTLQAIYSTESSQTVTKDLEAIVRDCLYVIVDQIIYGSAPQNETDVHRRIEGILRCVFPDLLSKPPLSKPIKNFEPDTGIPSIGTIIEYKFISERKHVGPLADEVLADTRGYSGDKWKSVLYVIYETERFKPEAEWRQFLRSCENKYNVSVIVLNGASISPKVSR